MRTFLKIVLIFKNISKDDEQTEDETNHQVVAEAMVELSGIGSSILYQHNQGFQIHKILKIYLKIIFFI